MKNILHFLLDPKIMKQNLVMVVGVIVTAFAVSVFYLPNKIVSGGVSGISTILYHTLHVQPGASFAVINTVLLLIALKFIGKQFVIRTVAGAALLSLCIQIFSYLPPLTDNIILATVFGSILYGFGIGLTLVVGASTGGTDILGRLLQHFFSHIKIGRALLIIDFVVVISSLLVFGKINLSLWGIIALFLSTFSVDYLIHKLNISKLAFVVTDCGEEVAKLLVSTSPRGVTLLNAVGAYTMTGKTVLMCALKESEIPQMQRNVLSIDPTAFIIFSESQQIVGNGFHVYR